MRLTPYALRLMPRLIKRSNTSFRTFAFSNTGTNGNKKFIPYLLTDKDSSLDLLSNPCLHKWLSISLF